MRTHICILYKYELYKLIIKIYVHKYVSTYFVAEKCFSLLVQKNFYFIFIIIIIKFYAISLSLKKLMYFFFLKLY